MSTTASLVSLPSPVARSSLAASSSMASATMVLSTVLGQAMLALDPTARNSNLFPVKANGEVRLRSPE